MITKERWDRIVSEARSELEFRMVENSHRVHSLTELLFRKLQEEAESERSSAMLNFGEFVKKPEPSGVLVTPSEPETNKYFVSGFINSDELNTSAPFGTVVSDVPFTVTGEELIKVLCKKAVDTCKLPSDFLLSSVTLTYFKNLNES